MWGINTQENFLKLPFPLRELLRQHSNFWHPQLPGAEVIWEVTLCERLQAGCKTACLLFWGCSPIEDPPRGRKQNHLPAPEQIWPCLQSCPAGFSLSVGLHRWQGVSHAAPTVFDPWREPGMKLTSTPLQIYPLKKWNPWAENPTC